MFCLIDANNFYASCERLFRPDLRNKPIVVLSNNDGCVIARSNEAKIIGVKMGEPYFKAKALCKQHNIQVFSSNYTLYGDLSHRVMSVIQDAWENTEIYSIDEAFLDLRSLPLRQVNTFCETLQKRILNYTGIPTSIGIGSTKTLAKIANQVAKKHLKIPVFNMTEQPYWLAKIHVGDVWGVGRQWQKKLSRKGINTAADLASMNPSMAKTEFNVALQRTVLELQGTFCQEIAPPALKQSIVSSRSFGRLQTDYLVLQEAVSHHCATAAAKMRKQGLIAHHLSVFIRSSPFKNGLKQYANSIGLRLINPTDDVRKLTQAAKRGLHQIYQAGICYQKCGIMLADLSGKHSRQQDLFNQPTDEALLQNEKLMQVLDAINSKYGARTVRLAAEGLSKPWAMKQQRKSPNYTTQWAELPIAYVK